LIKAGADVNARDFNGRGPLYHAVIAGYREMTDTLIANMASVFAFDYHGNQISKISLDPGINFSLQKGYMVSKVKPALMGIVPNISKVQGLRREPKYQARKAVL
jgi:ankyrin repeat protein